MASVTELITDQEIPPDTVIAALLPLAAHATLMCGFSKEDFMETAELTWDGIQERFGRPLDDSDLNESEQRWIAAFRGEPCA